MGAVMACSQLFVPGFMGIERVKVSAGNGKFPDGLGKAAGKVRKRNDLRLAPAAAVSLSGRQKSVTYGLSWSRKPH